MKKGVEEEGETEGISIEFLSLGTFCGSCGLEKVKIPFVKKTFFSKTDIFFQGDTEMHEVQLCFPWISSKRNNI